LRAGPALDARSGSSEFAYPRELSCGADVAAGGQLSRRGKLGLIVLGAIAGLLFVEISLQAAAVVVRFTTQRSASGWQGTDALKLLALGDSNTYGLWVNEGEAYPRVLETLWNATPERPHLEVLNLGFPGTNSSQLRNRLPKLLALLRPDIVTVMVGVNDFWTAAEPVGDDTTWRERLDFLAWRYSRLYRLLSMLRRAFTVQIIDVPRSPDRAEEPLVVQVGDERVALRPDLKKELPATGRTSLHDNLVALAHEATLAGAELVLLTYPADAPLSPRYASANTQIRRAAADAGVRLIDLGPAISGSCSPASCDTLLWDHHPSVLGHQRAASLIMEALSRPQTARQ
jgi:lysophospholipase L1-like esterase